MGAGFALGFLEFGVQGIANVLIVVGVGLDLDVGAALGLLTQHGIDDRANQIGAALVQTFGPDGLKLKGAELLAIVICTGQVGPVAPQRLIGAITD